MGEIIISVEVNRFRIELNFGEWGKYICKANKNPASTKGKFIVTVCYIANICRVSEINLTFRSAYCRGRSVKAK